MMSKISPSSITEFLHYSGTFHRNIKVLLTIIQVFALMPINGISAPTASSLHYSFCSPRNIYAVLVITANLILAAIIAYFNIATGCTFDKIFPLIWFTINPFIMYQFIRLASKWSALMQYWETFEMTIAQRDNNIDKQMRKIIFYMSICIPTMALVEHSLSLSKSIYDANVCAGPKDVLSAFFTDAFPAYFYFFEVNLVNGISLLFMNLCATFAWSMTDAFIVVVCLGLITQFRHFNKHFSRFSAKQLPGQFWEKKRVYFTKLTNLLDRVNNDMAVLILTSFVVNTFYIFAQLYHIIIPSHSTIRQVYFWYSLIYLIGKTLLVSITAIVINDEAKKPIKVLESLGADVYGSEVKRFMYQLTSATIALGGMQFFYITRTFLISIAGTIVTYEIVLMQFHKDPIYDDDPCKG